MDKVDGYDVIEAISIYDLKVRVAKGLKVGFQPLGGITILEAVPEKEENQTGKLSKRLLYFQAMVSGR